MQLVLVRHGQSANNAAFIAATARQQAQPREEPDDEADRIAEELSVYRGRVPDPLLTDLGTRQAQALGEALKAGRLPFAPTHLYASPMSRAVATARPLAEVSGLPVVLQPDAYEVGGIQNIDLSVGTRSARPGATLPELQILGGAVQAPPGLFPADDQPWSGGFEVSPDEALPRARRMLTTLFRAHQADDVVVVVSHQFFAQFVLAAALGLETEPWRRFRVDNAGHLSLRLGPDEAITEWVNRVDHLDPADISN
ncbi:histidine phosphatase family protein [Kineosporia succinea]|uniref:2,3-bisphosphoglycerate-dependent phosphoglycerate mutase n=1 Tax=Kineosporia succinea TaxID=84632 RepID=A0ABT9P6W2_9ACTN|nr:histidine phosphatase family protein [Kineosporia succinea]MDP9828442.1 2,3-bisphosphoglycerate-dependent phosphoglycerate mutase [Kineosporia succinea]